MTTISKERGDQAEKNAEQLLNKHGLKTIARNYRSRVGEIDLVMQDGETLVFAEVRYRKNHYWGTALETISQYKQTKIVAAAESYLLKHRHPGPIRFDVIGFDGHISNNPKWIKNAFETD